MTSPAADAPGPADADDSLAAALARPGAGALLEIAMTARFAPHRGLVDVATAAATEFGVTPRTIRRWLQDHPERPTVPRRRLEQVLGALQPSDTTRTREQLELEHAEQGLRRVRLGARRGDWAQWHNTTWLSPHTVVVLEIPGRGLRRVAITRDSPATVTRLCRGQRLVEHITVANKFAGAVVRHAVLAHVDPWRVEVGPGAIARGHTQLWLYPAHLPALTELAAGSRLLVRPGIINTGQAPSQVKKA